MKYIPWLILLLVTASSMTLGQQPANWPEWKIVGQINGNNVEFKCIEGCMYTHVNVGCRELANCRWTLDQSGITTYAEPFDMKKEIEEAQNIRQ